MTFFKPKAPRNPIQFTTPKIMVPHSIEDQTILENCRNWHARWALDGNEKRDRDRHTAIANKIQETLNG